MLRCIFGTIAHFFPFLPLFLSKVVVCSMGQKFIIDVEEEVVAESVFLLFSGTKVDVAKQPCSWVS